MLDNDDVEVFRDIPIQMEEVPEEFIEEEVQIKESSFYENIASKLNEYQRKKIATIVLEGIKADLDSRKEWEQTLADGIKLMGLTIEKSKDLKTKITDPLMLRAYLSFMANRYELYPEDGIADYTIDGPSSDEIEKSSDARKDFLNHYLYITDKDYKSDCERSDAYLCISGNAFKKVYRDPVTKMPLSRFIKPQDMILDNNASTLRECARKTQVEHITKKDIALRVESGFYIESKVLSESEEYNLQTMEEDPINIVIRDIYGIEDNYDKKTLFRYLECHCSLDEDFILEMEEHKDFGLPYIVHICAQTNELVGLYRGWDEDKKDYAEDDCFIHRKFIPGFGLYALGFAHILANASEALTAMDRMLIDAETYANNPVCLVPEGIRLTATTMNCSPGSLIPVGNAGMPLKDAVMQLPFKGASLVLKELANEWRGHWQSIDMGIESKLAEQSPNMPVGTTMALMESQGRMYSMIIKSILISLGEELRMIDALFKESFEDEPYVVYTNGVKLEISKKDYYDHVTIIPACSPDISSSMHRIMISDAVLRTMQTAPELHNRREVYKRLYQSFKVNDIDSILLPEEKVLPLDPLSENANALQNKPLKVAAWQDQDAHIAAHQAMMQSPEAQQNPMSIQILNEHLMTHIATKYMLEMQQQMGIQMPDNIEELQNPELQNAIARKLAPIMQERQAAQAQAKPMDPTAVMMADVQQRDEAAKMKAEVDRMRIELDAYKAQLNFEQSKEKIEADMEMAEDRNETNLEIEHLKHGEYSNE